MTNRLSSSKNNNNNSSIRDLISFYEKAYAAPAAVTRRTSSPTLRSAPITVQIPNRRPISVVTNVVQAASTATGLPVTGDSRCDFYQTIGSIEQPCVPRKRYVIEETASSVVLTNRAVSTSPSSLSTSSTNSSASSLNPTTTTSTTTVDSNNNQIYIVKSPLTPTTTTLTPELAPPPPPPASLVKLQSAVTINHQQSAQLLQSKRKATSFYVHKSASTMKNGRSRVK
jgi:hypothetical protein